MNSRVPKQQVKVDLDSSSNGEGEEELQRISEITMEQDNSGLRTNDAAEERRVYLDGGSLDHSANSEDNNGLRVLIEEARDRERLVA